MTPPVSSLPQDFECPEPEPGLPLSGYIAPVVVPKAAAGSGKLVTNANAKAQEVFGYKVCRQGVLTSAPKAGLAYHAFMRELAHVRGCAVAHVDAVVAQAKRT